MVDISKFLFGFQAEHIFADSHFKSGTLIGDFLADIGYKKMLSATLWRTSRTPIRLRDYLESASN